VRAAIAEISAATTAMNGSGVAVEEA